MNSQIKSLNGMKVISVILIFLWHVYISSPFPDFGARACELFFTISGFLVGYNYFYKGMEPTWKMSITYTAKKLIKFWPLHIISMIAIWMTKQHPWFTFDRIIKALLNGTLLHAWSTDQSIFFSYNGVSWFLSALVFCYFVTPLLLQFAKKVKISSILFLGVILIRYCLEYIMNTYPDQYWRFNVHTSPVIRGLEYFAGMLMVPLFFYIKERMEGKKYKALFSILEMISLLFIIYIIYSKAEVWMRGAYILPWCILIFIYAFDSGIFSNVLALKPFEWFGVIQFEFFILHQVVAIWLGGRIWQLVPDQNIQSSIIFVLVIAASIIYKKCFSKILEKWMKVILNKVFGLLEMNIIV